MDARRCMRYAGSARADGLGWAYWSGKSNRPHSIIFTWLTPGLPSPCIARQMFCRRAGSVAYGPRMPGPPLPMTTLVRLDAHSRASALMTRAEHAALGGCPLRRLRHAIFFAHDIGFVRLDAHGVGLQIVLVVGAVLEPLIGDRQVQRRVSIRQDRDPAIGMDSGGVVEIRADVNLLDAQFAVPVAQTAGELTLPAPRRGLLVAAPEQQQFTVLGNVIEQVALLALAYGFAAPEVLAAPPPAFPAVGLPDLERIAAPQREQLAAGAVAGLHHLVLTVLVALVEKRGWSVLLLDPVHLAGDGVECLVPGDAHVLALAAVLRIALAVGVPVHPLHRDSGRGPVSRRASCRRWNKAAGASLRLGSKVLPRTSIFQGLRSFSWYFHR